MMTQALAELEKHIDTASAAGELVLHVFGPIAHVERRLISGHEPGYCSDQKTRLEARRWTGRPSRPRKHLSRRN